MHKPPELATIVRVEELTILPQNQPPTVSILGGTGQQGRGLAQRLAHAGVPVDRRLARPRARARETRRRLDDTGGRHADRRCRQRRGGRRRRRDDPRRPVRDGGSPAAGSCSPHFRAGSLVDRPHRPGHVRGRQNGDARRRGGIGGRARQGAASVRPSGWRARSRRCPPICSAPGLEPLDCDEFVCGDSDERAIRGVGARRAAARAARRSTSGRCRARDRSST